MPHKPYDSSAFEGPSFRKKRDVPDGLWLRCPGCEKMLYRKAVAENSEVCPECQHHFRMSGKARISQLADPDTFEELFADIAPADPLEFKWLGQSYADRVRAEQAKTNNTDAVLTGIAFVKGRRLALGVMDGDFLMGSMGSVVGEKLSLLIEEAATQSLPLVIVCMSGGARMHEGALSLMQMAKTSAALAKFDDAGGLYIAILADPTTGGTTASFAMLGDVIIAEPGALIGFAGQRVIANTIRAELPEGFQRAEFLLEHGFIDMITPRKELRNEIARLIDYCGKQ
ncbi:MAG: acetyl-CoA carboxylase carboxyltransferase subunit beta [Planctomycetaceae bacterium]|nr:MAG: acetyl-CoA carboxylase carboxyltransferase subunit beta [Planctomycetaceae bacterium]